MFVGRIKKTCRTMLCGVMQNHGGPKNMCKKTKKNKRRTELDR